VFVLALDDTDFFLGGMLTDGTTEESNWIESWLRYRNKIQRTPSDVRCENTQTTPNIYVGQTVFHTNRKQNTLSA
jgi:hypothetical protein